MVAAGLSQPRAGASTSVGTPEQVRDDLERRRTEAGADELVITTQIHDPAERRLSYELIAKAYGI